MRKAVGILVTVCVGLIRGMPSADLESKTQAACSLPLGLESGLLPDSQISATSSHEPMTVGPSSGRLNHDDLGGAWCPASLVARDAAEHLQVDLLATHRITAVKTQGRFGNGHGREFAEAFVVEYWRQGMDNFTRYVARSGRDVLEANTNTYSVKEVALDPPIAAQIIRIIPYAKHPRTVCMRVELIGCGFDDAIISYSGTLPLSDMSEGLNLSDESFDGIKADGRMSNGLGQLTDGVVAKRNLNEKDIGGYDWVGWKNESSSPIELSFSFDVPRLVTSVKFHTDLGSLSLVRVHCGGEDGRASYAFDAISPAETVELRTADGQCRTDEVRMEIRFRGKWLAVSEVEFDSVPLTELESHHEDIYVNLSPSTSSSSSSSSWPYSSVPLGVALGLLVTVLLLLLLAVAAILKRERGRWNNRRLANTTLLTPYSSECSRKSFLDRSDTLTTVLQPQQSPIYSEPIYSVERQDDYTNGVLLSGTLLSRPCPDWRDFEFPDPPSVPPPLPPQNHGDQVECYATTQLYQDMLTPPPSNPFEAARY